MTRKLLDGLSGGDVTQKTLVSFVRQTDRRRISNVLLLTLKAQSKRDDGVIWMGLFSTEVGICSITQ